MFLRGQQLSPGALRDFGALFGPVEAPIRDRFKVPGQDDVYVISNIVEDGKPIGNPNDGFGWHTDQKETRQVWEKNRQAVMGVKPE